MTTNNLIPASSTGGGLIAAAGAAAGATYWDAKTTEELVTLPVIKTSVATQVSTVLRPAPGTVVEVPVIDELVSEDDGPAWHTDGAELVELGDPNARSLFIEHHDLGAKKSINWRALSDASHDVTGMYGNALTQSMTTKIDRTVFNADESSPVPGLNKLAGVKELAAGAGGALKDLDIFLDAQEHAENLDTMVTHFVCAPATATMIAKIKRAEKSAEPLLGTAERPGSATINGVPLLTSRHVKPGVIWAIPSDRLILSIPQDVMVKWLPDARAAHAQGLLVGLLRFGFGCLQPEALAKITVNG